MRLTLQKQLDDSDGDAVPVMNAVAVMLRVGVAEPVGAQTSPAVGADRDAHRAHRRAGRRSFHPAERGAVTKRVEAARMPGTCIDSGEGRGRVNSDRDIARFVVPSPSCLKSFIPQQYAAPSDAAEPQVCDQPAAIAEKVTVVLTAKGT